MKEFWGYSIAYAILIGGLAMLGGVFAVFLGVPLLIGMHFTALQLAHRENRERLERIEKKLDQLLEQKSDPQE